MSRWSQSFRVTHHHGSVILGGTMFDEDGVEHGAECVIGLFDTEAEAIAAAPALAEKHGVPYEGSQEDYWNPSKHS